MIVSNIRASTGAPLVLTFLQVPSLLGGRLWLLEDCAGTSIGSGRLAQGLVLVPAQRVVWIEVEAFLEVMWRSIGLYSCEILPRLARWCDGELYSDTQRSTACTRAWQAAGAELVAEPISLRDRFRLITP